MVDVTPTADDHPVTHHAADADAHAHAAAHRRERGDVHAAIVLAMDESDAAQAALGFALERRQETDDLYLLSVLPPLATANSFAPAVAPSIGMAGVARSWEEQRVLDEKAAAALLRAAAREARKRGVPRANLHAHVLPAGGGASGVAASISEFVRARHGKGSPGDKSGVALVVVGSRGLGAGKAAWMAALGLGSVSDYVLNHSPAPVAVVRPVLSAIADAPSSDAPPPPRVVVLALDESPHSDAALACAAERGWLGGGGGLSPSSPGAPPSPVRVRVVCSAAAVPFPVLDETAAAMAIESSRAWEDAAASAEAYALEVAERHARRARDLLLRRATGGGALTGAEAEAAALARLDIAAVALKSGGAGTAGAGAAVAAYARDEGATLVVAGSRGMSALRAAVAGLVGLGSVSLYLAHHAPCPLIVVRSCPDAAEAGGKGGGRVGSGGGGAAAGAEGSGGGKAEEGKQD